MAAASALSLLGDQMLYSVLPSAYGELGLVPIQVGLVLSMNRWVRLLTNHLAARLCERCDMAWLAGLAGLCWLGLPGLSGWLDCQKNAKNAENVGKTMKKC